MKPKIGTICYATQSGLGHLAKWFYENGIVDRILLLPHPRYESHADSWYRKEDQFTLIQRDKFLQDVDVILVFENVFTQWGVIHKAKEIGIKFVIIPMYEWTPNPLPVKPDMVICPSLLDIDYFNQYPHLFLNIPSPQEKDIPWKERNVARTFVHNAGHGQVGYAKGTPEVMEAFAHHVKSGAKLVVRGQHRESRIKELFDKYSGYKNITIEYGDKPYNQLFNDYDVYINAERYNGLSLPLQEAYSAGMLVMTTNRFPANTWLPHEPLIPVEKTTIHKVNQTEFEYSTIDPKTIAKCVDDWYMRDITLYSLFGKNWREKHSWDILKPKYLEIFQGIL